MNLTKIITTSDFIISYDENLLLNILVFHTPSLFSNRKIHMLLSARSNVRFDLFPQKLFMYLVLMLIHEYGILE